MAPHLNHPIKVVLFNALTKRLLQGKNLEVLKLVNIKKKGIKPFQENDKMMRYPELRQREN